MNPVDRRRGHYLGTEIEEKWWRRYKKDGFFMRGLGECWIEDGTLFFRRYLTRTPLAIVLEQALELKTGKWHAGRWAGGAPVVKIVWIKDGVRLSSGFVFWRDPERTQELVGELQAAMSGRRRKAQP